jgi:plastocyanin
MRAAALILVVTTASAAADGGAVHGKINVKRPEGADPRPVVVYLTGFTEPPPTTVATIVQRDKRFSPALVAITAGQSVAFPNGDPFLHNVFSPTPSRRFDLGSFPKGDSRARVFPEPGVIDVFCNIHPEMSATILVLPNRKFTQTSEDGAFSLADVPAGKWILFAYSRRAEAPVHVAIEVRAGETTEVTLDLVEQRRTADHRNKFGETYRDPSDSRYH